MVKRKGIYFATLVVILAVVAGYAAASFALSTSTQRASGNYVNGASSVTGLTYTITTLNATASPAPTASTGTGPAPQALVAGVNAFCGNTCTAGDFSQQIEYTFTAGMTGAIFITLYVSATSLGGSTTVFLIQASSPVAGTIVIYWDLGTVGNTLNSVTTTAQSCGGATCT
ncbi:MAG: hypothetical protein WAN87_03590 [Thermoplasmata archaeon]